LKILVLLDVSLSNGYLDKDIIVRETAMPVSMNAAPQNDGWAIFSGDRVESAPWSWADFVVVLGHVEIGRHHADEIVDPPPADITSYLLTFYDSLSEYDDTEDSGVDQGRS